MIYREAYELMEPGLPFPRRYLTTGTVGYIRDILGTTEVICRIVVEPLPVFIPE